MFLFPQSFVWFTKESYESCVAKVGLEPTGMQYQNRWNVKNIWIKGQYMVSNMVGSPLSSILSWLKNADCIVWILSRLSLFKIATDRSSKHQNGQNFVRICIFCGENTNKKNHIHKSFYLTSVSFLGPKYFKKFFWWTNHEPPCLLQVLTYIHLAVSVLCLLVDILQCVYIIRQAIRQSLYVSNDSSYLLAAKKKDLPWCNRLT